MNIENLNRANELILLIARSEKIIQTLEALKETLVTDKVTIGRNSHCVYLETGIAKVALILQLEQERERLTVLRQEFDSL